MQIFVLLQIAWYLNFTDQERYLKFTTNGLANLPEKGYPYSMQWSNLMQHQSENIMDTCDIFSIDKFAQICMYLVLSNISVLLKPWKSCDIHIVSVIPSFDIFPHQLFFRNCILGIRNPHFGWIAVFGYESQTINFYGHLSLIPLCFLTLTFVFIYYFNKFFYSLIFTVGIIFLLFLLVRIIVSAG